MNLALFCKGKSKFDKYKFRTDRVLKDVLWHVLAIKRCTNETSARRRRGVRTKARKTSKKGMKQPTTPMEDVGMISDIGTLQNQVLNSIEGYGHIADNITEKDAKILFNEKVTTDLKKHQLNIEGKIIILEYARLCWTPQYYFRFCLK